MCEGNEIPEVLFLLPVTSALARAGLQLYYPTLGFPGAHRGCFYALIAPRNGSRGSDALFCD